MQDWDEEMVAWIKSTVDLARSMPPDTLFAPVLLAFKEDRFLCRGVDDPDAFAKRARARGPDQIIIIQWAEEFPNGEQDFIVEVTIARRTRARTTRLEIIRDTDGAVLNLVPLTVH